jgi:hypothetical protein
MTWLLWRQHRLQMAISAAALAAFGVAVWITGLVMAHDYTSAVHACRASGTCDLLTGNLFQGDGAIIDLVHLSIAVPVLLGVFIGAPLVAREAEHATNVLAWSQTVTRRRWLVAKVAAALAAAVVIAALVSVLVTWWSGTPNSFWGNRFDGGQFDTQNVVPIAYALFAVALGIVAGCFLRKVLPAVAVTVVGFVAARLVVGVYLRPHLLSSARQTFSLYGSASVPSGSMVVRTQVIDPAGHPISGTRIPIPDSCRAAASKSGVLQCLDRIGYRQIVTYQPPGHYWPTQWIEAGLFVAVAAALVAVGVVHTLRHDA